MNFRLTILISCFFICKSYSQDKEIQLKGQILEFEKPVVGAHVYNTNTFQGESTSKEGEFSIKVNVNDTLVISHLNYFTVKIVVDPQLVKKHPLIIHMYEKTNQLDTVNIKNHDLTQNLKMDSESRPRIANRDSLIAEFQRLAKMPSFKFYRNTEAPALINTDPTKGFIGGTSSGGGGVATSVGFKFKDIELRNSLRVKRSFPHQLISDFGIAYFTKTLKIPKEKVFHFITYCEYRNIMELYKKDDLLKILTILQEESIEYLKIEG